MLDNLIINNKDYHLHAVIYHPPKHWITAFKNGSRWLLRDDDRTYILDEGFEKKYFKKTSSLCLYTSNLPTYEEIEKKDQSFKTEFSDDIRDIYLEKYE